MHNTVIDDRFDTGGKVSKTTRFYGLKFIEGKSNIGSTFGSSVIEDTLGNPREYFREVYGPFLCMLLVTAALTFISGAALSLAGYYVPAVTVKNLLSSNVSEKDAITKVNQYTKTLHTMRIGGIILLGIGGISMTALILTPFICLRRSAYIQLNNSASEISPAVSPPLFTQRKTPLNRDYEPNFSYYITKQHVQPRCNMEARPDESRNTESRNTESDKIGQNRTKTRTKTQNHRTSHNPQSSYSPGFLSPELNRGPIFVSDETRRIDDRFRVRSSSCCTTSLSPELELQKGYRKSSVNISDLVNMGKQGATLVKTGSFHSLKST